jgi:uncharacterized protein
LILIDAGPLVDADDQHNAKCVATLRDVHEPLATVWPPLTEAMYLLADVPKAQEALWEMLTRGAVQLLPLDLRGVPRKRELMGKYADRAMDLADAALVRVAEREGIRKIFTVDHRDFAIYRLYNRVRLTIIAQSWITASLGITRSAALEKVCFSPSGRLRNPGPALEYPRSQTDPPNESGRHPQDQSSGLGIFAVPA